jgi:hypothetical protein
LSEREKIHDSQPMYAVGPIIPDHVEHENGNLNGTIRLVIGTTRLACLLHESCY